MKDDWRPRSLETGNAVWGLGVLAQPVTHTQVPTITAIEVHAAKAGLKMFAHYRELVHKERISKDKAFVNTGGKSVIRKSVHTGGLTRLMLSRIGHSWWGYRLLCAMFAESKGRWLEQVHGKDMQCQKSADKKSGSEGRKLGNAPSEFLGSQTHDLRSCEQTSDRTWDADEHADKAWTAVVTTLSNPAKKSISKHKVRTECC